MAGWQCPYCLHYSTLSGSDARSGLYWLFEKTSNGDVGINYLAVKCPNGECRKLSLRVFIYNVEYQANKIVTRDLLHSWRLLPESFAKPQPDYIPAAIREDYAEACAIRDKSPKASATLARRCLQGMIRDFWQIRKNTLFAEINALEEKVDPDIWAAIKAVKDVGNIGAHMEKDINVIVDVDPDEAQVLISLIEQLLDEWYVSRQRRQERMASVVALAQNKKEQRQNGKHTTGALPLEDDA